MMLHIALFARDDRREWIDSNLMYSVGVLEFEVLGACCIDSVSFHHLCRCLH